MTYSMSRHATRRQDMRRHDATLLAITRHENHFLDMRRPDGYCNERYKEKT